jgi:formylglycine-generating enzyme required for sulfatase activity
VGIGVQEQQVNESTPQSLSGKIKDKYPWNGAFPPKTAELAGNYSDITLQRWLPSSPCIGGYNDKSATTAAVMSFKPNKIGIYDLGGNVWEWVEDWWNAEKTERVLRGGSFLNNEQAFMLSSHRDPLPPTGRENLLGFRVVLSASR